jgi:hypothetical protein
MMATNERPETTTCWCGCSIAREEKRTIFGVAWCAQCFERILRSCPRALRNARKWVDDEEP